MISAVVLAAGLSKRMGKPKPVLPYGKRSVIEHIVFSLCKTGIDEIVVITGHEGDLVSEYLEGLPVRVVHNFGYEQGGMLSSVKTGIQVVSLGGTRDKNDAGTGSSDVEAILFCLADQPAIEPDVVTLLMNTFENGQEDKILIPSFEKRAGHPILVPAAFWKRILSLPPVGSLRDVTQAPETPVHYVEVATDSVVRDMNTPEEYEKELGRLEKKG
jgi:molybdenum cofactor cytidylyltransferase